MAKLIFEHSNEEVELDDGAPIAEPCEEAGVPFACTEGVCGTCVVQITQGCDNLTPPTQEELDFLGDEVGEERLACQCAITKDSVSLTF